MRLAFGGVFATVNAPLNKLQCPEDLVCRGDGERLILDLLEQLDDPSRVTGLTWARDFALTNHPQRCHTDLNES